MKWLHVICFTLVIIGGINWGLWGFFNYNLVAALFGPLGLEKLIYILVGCSAVYLIIAHKGDCKTCMMMSGKKK